jgi:hypothetical protein
MDSPNPFVRSALALIDEIRADGGEIDVHTLAERLAEREPMLSPLNLDCAAREALRIALLLWQRERADIGSGAAAVPAPDNEEPEEFAADVGSQITGVNVLNAEELQHMSRKGSQSGTEMPAVGV